MIPLKTATVQDDYAWIWDDDEAIDKAKDDWRTEYDAALESGDLDRLPLKPGVKPTVFWLRHPSPALRRVMAGFFSTGKEQGLASRRCAQYSLVRADGTGLELKWQSRCPDTGFDCVPDKTMDVLDGVPDLVDSIALAVLKEMSRPS